MGIIAGNIMAAIPIVQLNIKIKVAIGFNVIIASIVSGCTKENIHAIAETEIIETKIIF
jgi:hypothetical protein